MRITNLHLIISFLILSAIGFFAYQYYRRSPLPPPEQKIAQQPPAPPPVPEEEQRRQEEQRRAEAQRLLDESRVSAEASLAKAAEAVTHAQGEGLDAAAAAQTLLRARDLLAQAQVLEDFNAAQVIAEEAAQQALQAKKPEADLDLYVVQRGDNLWNISKRKDVYARGAGWVKIWRANESQIPDFDHLYSGLKLKIPRD